MAYERPEKVKFLCWDDDNCHEEDAEDILEDYDDNYEQVAHAYAEKVYLKEPTDWSDKGVDIKLKNLNTGKTYSFTVSTEYEPVFHCSLTGEEDGKPAVATNTVSSD